MDSRAVNVSNDREKTAVQSNKPVSLEKAAPSRAAISPSNALKINDLVNAWYQGNCEHCKQDFKKKTTWQRFCCPECRDENYFLRTGKKWHGKKRAGTA